MEDRTPKEESSGSSSSSSSTHKGQESQSYQRRMWKNFTGKTKPWLSPKLGSERRSSGGADGSKKESGLWMFKRKKKQMDRVFSSSQPNLSSSHPPSFKGGASPGGDPLPGTSAGGPMQPLMGAAAGPTGSKPELTTHGSPKLAVTQLILSQQKSSSLGSACFEKLVVDPAVLALGEEAELRKNASDSVSYGTGVVEPVWWNRWGETREVKTASCPLAKHKCVHEYYTHILIQRKLSFRCIEPSTFFYTGW
ncbi:unnamed protein product [Arctogadus glacialis]